MSAIIFFVCIGIMAAGTKMNIKECRKEELMRHNGFRNGAEFSFAASVAAGLAGYVALIGIIMMSSGSKGKAGMVLGGIAVSVLVCLKELKIANENVRLLKKAGREDLTKSFAPLLIWGKITLIGIGKVTHAIFICTLIGIPLYNMMSQVQINMEELANQIALRQELEALKKAETRGEIRRYANEYAANQTGVSEEGGETR